MTDYDYTPFQSQFINMNALFTFNLQFGYIRMYNFSSIGNMIFFIISDEISSVETQQREINKKPHKIQSII